jgi:hypothetical protein
MPSLLRSHQRKEMKDELDTLHAKLKNPHIEDKGAVQRQIQRLQHQADTQTPKPFLPSEIDAAVKLEKDLRDKIMVGMPSQEEMRKSPPGAIGKHMAWEKRNKKNIEEWKNTQLRMNHDSTDPDVANFERYRPVASTLNMHNAHIPGQQYFMPPTSPQYAEGYDRIYNNDDAKPDAQKKDKKPGKKKYSMSPEARAAAGARMKAMHAAKATAKVVPAEVDI